MKMMFLNLGALRWHLPKRFIVAILGFTGMFNISSLLTNLSVALVAMVNSTSSFPENRTILYGECPAENNTKTEIEVSNSQAERYNWDSVDQSHILGAHFIGYIVAVFVGGYLADRLGAHRMFGAGIFVTSVLNLLTPITVRWGLAPLLVLRVLEGISEGVTFSSTASVYSTWAPVMERSRIFSVVTSGTMVGTVAGQSISGWLSSLNFLGGWPLAFYVFGTIGCIWYLLWCVFIFESPFKHPTITADELMLYGDDIKISKKKLKVPWCSIFSSIPVWAFIIAYSGSTIADVLMLTELPTYLSSVLRMDVKKAGIYSAIPNITLCFGCWTASIVADSLREKGKLGITNLRKIFNSVGGYVTTLALICVPYCGCQSWLVVLILSIGMFVNGCKYSGCLCSCIDMSPTYASIVCCMAIGISSLTSSGAVGVVGILTKSGSTVAVWSKVFYIFGAVSAIAATFFALVSSSELQTWDNPAYREENDNNVTEG